MDEKENELQKLYERLTKDDPLWRERTELGKLLRKPFQSLNDNELRRYRELQQILNINP